MLERQPYIVLVETKAESREQATLILEQLLEHAREYAKEHDLIWPGFDPEVVVWKGAPVL